MSARRPSCQRSRRSRLRANRRLALEALEPRHLLTVFTVNSLEDLGDNDLDDGQAKDLNGNTTLRAAIEHINHIGGSHRIAFSVTGAIAVGSPGLPDIAPTVEIDGLVSGGARIELTLAPSATAATGLRLKGPGSQVRNMVIHTFGIAIELAAGSDGSQIEGNHLGVSSDGTTALGGGVFVISSNNDIGLAADATRNVVSSISVIGSDNRVKDNYVGLRADGLQALTNIATYSTGILVGNGANNVIGGTTPQERNVVGGYQGNNADQGAAGIRIRGGQRYSGQTTDSNPRNTRVLGNFVGTDKDGVNAIPNSMGIRVTDASADEGQHLIGNLVSGNLRQGISIAAFSPWFTKNVAVKGNIIGLQANGTDALGNGFSGIGIAGATGNTIGGQAKADRNVISANGRLADGSFIPGDGISFLYTGLVGQPGERFATGNKVIGNFIGTDQTGTLDRGNAFQGILIGFGNNNNQIGGANEGEGNLISGNDRGIYVLGAHDNRFWGNQIERNSRQGIFLHDAATRNSIGGPNTGEGNLIADNSNAGIWILHATDNRVQGNAIVDNGSSGVFLDGGSARNLIGGPNDGEGNVMTRNGFDGVSLRRSASQDPQQNAILGNHISANGRLGIDLGLDGITANDLGNPAACPANPAECPDTDAGANNRQNAPVVERVSSTSVRVTLDSTPGATFRIEVFDNEVPDPSGFGEGQFFRTGFNVTTDARGHFSGVQQLGVLLNTSFVTATATRIEGGVFTDTSEFSGFTRFVVNSTADLPDNNPGDGLIQIGELGNIRQVTVGGQQVNMVTLRAAIMEANALAGSQLISFNIPPTDPGFSDGVYTIRPAVNDSPVNQEDVPADKVQYRITDPVTIDATTQPGFNAQSRAPIVRLDGGDPTAGEDGVVIDSDGVTVRGFVINRFRGDGIDIARGMGNHVEGNYIGTHHTGDTLTAGGTDLRNGGYGVRIHILAHHNDVGGSEPGQGNLISGNRLGGIRIDGTPTDEGNNILGNLIGTDKTGELGLGNGVPGVGGPGVHIHGGTSNSIGGGYDGAANVIAASRGDGVLVTGGAQYTEIYGNRIGVSRSGDKPLPNEGNGVRIGDLSLGGATDTFVGDILPEAGNVISANVQAGIFIRGEDSGKTRIDNNLIGTNATGNSSGPNREFGNGQGGVRIEDAPDARVGDLSAGNVISGNRSHGVLILDTTPGAGSNTAARIEANTIGLTQDGESPLGNQGDGIRIIAAQLNVVGGTLDSRRNIISANTGQGVFLGGGSQNNLISGNYIGTDRDGEVVDHDGDPENGNSLGNDNGVWIEDSSSNYVGHLPYRPELSSSGTGNVISGNSNSGVVILGSTAANNRVAGNYIGTDRDGLLARGNGASGVWIWSGQANTVGGTALGERNVLADNRAANVLIEWNFLDGPVPDQNNQVLGNYIGTNKTGQSILGASVTGVEIRDARRNTIGGVAMDLDRNAAANVIGGHLQDGILIVDSLGTGSGANVVQGNFIGVSGNLTPLPNQRDGVRLETARDSLIGGDGANQGNVIAANGSRGVHVLCDFGTDPRRNAIVGNSIFDNGELGIDLAGGVEDASGVTGNDPWDADGGSLVPNDLQNAPRLETADRNPQTATVLIAGRLESAPGTTYRIEYFASLPVDPSGYGEGQRLIGSQTVTTAGDGIAALSFQSTATVGTRDYITTTATRLDAGALKDTSEFSNAIGVGTRTISGIKFRDTNGNGQRDGGEPGIKDWLMFLFDDETNVQLQETRTRSDGSYTFRVDQPGRYRVEEEPQTDWVLTTIPVPPFDVADLPVAGKDFGNFELMTIRGIKFDDLNVNGTRDGNEPLLTGPFVINLDLPGTASDEQRSLAGASSYAFERAGPGDKTISLRTFTVGETITAPGFSRVFPTGAVEFDVRSGLDEVVDFANIRNMTVEVLKFHDIDGDGLYEPTEGEAALPGWDIIVDLNSDGADPFPGTPDPKQTTTASGPVAFTNVGIGNPDRARTLTVREAAQPGWRQTTATVTRPMQSGGVFSETIGNFREGAIYGFKFEDLDADGVFNGADRPVEDVTFLLLVDADRNGSYESMADLTVTDGAGEFSFTELGPGRYRVVEDVPDDAVATAQSFDLNLLSGEVAVAQPGMGQIDAGQVRVVFPDLNFGNFFKGAIHGYKFNDLDGRGVDNGDPRVAGIAIVLDIDADEDGQFESSRSSVTDSQGYYGFRDLGPGMYRVRETLTAEQQRTTPAPAVIDLRSGEVWVAQGGMALVTENQVQVLELDLAFGNFERVALGGLKFFDLNADGGRDAGEPPLSQWMIQLDLDSNGSIDRTATTGADGRYEFRDVGPGRHTLTEVLQAGYQQTAPAGGQHIVTTESGQDRSNLDFGNASLRSVIAGTKFRDGNGNGARDEGEPGLPGWIIYLDANNDGALNHEIPANNNVCDAKSQEPCLLTDENGAYAFSVPAGAYVVREVRQAGWQQTYPSPDGIHFVEVTGFGQQFVGRDFGNLSARGAIHGYIFEDFEADGVNNGDFGLPGAIVFLVESSLSIVESAQTDANGYYEFLDLPPGTYDVIQAAPDGAESTTGFFVTVILEAGEVYMAYAGQIATGPDETPRIDSGLAFGVFYFGEIRGYVFEDQDRDGMDDQEPRVGGVEIQMEVDADDDGQPDWVETTTTVAGTGEYAFPDLDYGRYWIRPVPSAGKAQTSPSPPGLYLFSSFIYVAGYGQVDESDPRMAWREPLLAFGQRDTWQNPTDRFDVDGQNSVTAGDVLDLVNYINGHPGNPALPAAPAVPPPYYDVNGDGFVTPDDVLQVINEINRRIAGEGEAVKPAWAAAPVGSSSLTQPANRGNSTHEDSETQSVAFAEFFGQSGRDVRLADACVMAAEKRCPIRSSKGASRELDAVFSQWQDLLPGMIGEISELDHETPVSES